MNCLRWDESGEVLSGFFYRLTIPFYDDSENWSRIAGTIVSQTKVNFDSKTWADLSEDESEEQIVRSCDINNDHYDFFASVFKSAELFGDEDPTPLVICNCSDGIVVSHKIVNLINEYSFHGLLLRKLDTIHHLSGMRAKKSVFQIVGSKAPRFRKRIWDLNCAANQCPFCGKGPIFCEKCGYLSVICPNCKKQTCAFLAEQKARNEGQIACDGGTEKGWIIDGGTWDGSDVFRLDCVTRRFVEWLLHIGAYPFVAKPLRVYVGGMTPKQRAMLDAAREFRPK